MSDLGRCTWCTSHPLYVAYHDDEWGAPVADGPALFERLVLEGMQAGLSWWTVLKKREHMQDQFFGFDPDKLSNATEDDVTRWLHDPGLIRHRGKIEAMIGNARAYLEAGDFASMVWSSVDGRPRTNRYETLSDVPGHTPEAAATAKRLKKAGFRFVGPTTVYAFMQSVGMVNDHVTSCPWHTICAERARAFSL